MKTFLQIAIIFLISVTARSETDQKFWIFFTDKGETDLRDAERSISPLSIRRRLNRAKISKIEISDFPVREKYINKMIEIGAKFQNESRWLNAISVTANTTQIQKIADLPFVKKVDPVRKFRSRSPKNRAELHTAPTPNYGNSETQISQMRADRLHEMDNFGEGVIIGLLDTGFSLDHDAFDQIKILDQYDFVNGDPDASDQIDQDDGGQDEHGSIVLSVIGGLLSGRLIGVAPKASFLLAKTEKNSENGVDFEREIEEDWCIAGLEWLERNGAEVINASIGYSDWYRFEELDGKTSPLTIAFEIAISKGIVTVVANGNQGGKIAGNGLGLPGRITVPADGFNVIAVGSIDADGDRTWFSSRGPTFDGRIKPDLVALGEKVTAIDPKTTSRISSKHRGTSLSAPLISGVVALLLNAFPNAKPIDLIEALRSTATNSESPNNEIGYGIVRADLAYQFLHKKFSENLIAIDPKSKLYLTKFAEIKQSSQLFQNYPNPFNAETWIPFKLSAPSEIDLTIYDRDGKIIRSFNYEPIREGNYTDRQNAIYWNGKNEFGEHVASGVYFAVLSVSGERSQIRMIVLE